MFGFKVEVSLPAPKSLKVYYSKMSSYRPYFVTSLGFSSNEKHPGFLKELEKTLNNMTYCEEACFRRRMELLSEWKMEYDTFSAKFRILGLEFDPNIKYGC